MRDADNISFIQTTSDWSLDEVSANCVSNMQASELRHRLMQYILVWDRMDTVTTLKQGERYKILKYYDPIEGTSYMDCYGSLSNGTFFLMSTPLEAVQDLSLIHICAMCDDELPFAEQLRSLVMAYAKKKRVELQAETFASAEELLEEIENGAGFEILFLDIEMRKMDGIELGKKLRERSYQTLIIYVSGYDQYMRQLFEAEPFRFLSKDVYKRQGYYRPVIEKTYDEYETAHKTLFEGRNDKFISLMDLALMGMRCLLYTSRCV